MSLKLDSRFVKTNGTVNRSEIIREAFRKLGTTASNGDVKNWAKREMKVDLSPTIMTIAKSCRLDVENELKRKHLETTVAANGHKGQADPVKPVQTSTQPAKVNKMDLVRKAITYLGGDPKPKMIQEWIKKNHFVDMGTDHISAYKVDIKRKEREEMKAKEKPTTKLEKFVESVAATPNGQAVEAVKVEAVKVEPVKVEPIAASQMSDRQLILGTITVVRDLIQRLTKDGLKELIDQL